MKNGSKKGFTLIELLVVIAIIGLLSTLAVVALNSARQKARDSKRVADVKQIQTALELYFADKNGYPDHGAGASLTLGSAGAKALCGGAEADFKDSCGTDTTYMGLVPSSPTPKDGACTDANNPYVYTQTGSGSGYTLTFCLGGPVGDLVADAHTADPNGIQ